jgi:hypothetical protein
VNDKTTNPPIECPYKNNGSCGLTYCTNTLTSNNSYYYVAQPLAPPEYPNPRKSIIWTSNPALA